MQRLRQGITEHTNPPVFIVSAATIFAFVLVGIIFTGQTSAAASGLQDFIVENFGWLYVFAATFFVIFAVAILFSRWGNVRLGPDNSRPEFSLGAWFSMLFTAGMGTGLVYYGVAEPMSHFTDPPTGEGGTAAAATTSMNWTFFHWGLHPWALYAVMGLALGYFSFRRRLPLRPSSALYPLIGERIHGPIGWAIDILSVFGTLFGLATSLGVGAQQVSTGLNTLFGIPNTTGLQILLILGITVVAVTSVMLGLDKGIRRFSLTALWLSVGLVIFLFVVGPGIFLLESLVANTGVYIQRFPETSFTIFPGSESGSEFQSLWTLFYWGWWISWSPFVGMFIARISYGRTIRQFLAGVLLAPVGASFIWLTTLGSTALNIERFGDGGIVGADPSNSLFVLLQELPIAGPVATVVSVLMILVVILYFVTSSDSASLVVDIITNGGDPNPLWQLRLFWAVTEGVVAAVVLYVGGTAAITALQAISISVGLPFVVLLLLICYCIVKGLREEKLPSTVPDPAKGEGSPPEPGRAVTRPQGAAAPHQMSGPADVQTDNRTNSSSRASNRGSAPTDDVRDQRSGD